MKEVCILGLGYIGLPTAAILASRGIKVRGVDTNKEICQTINSGNIHIAEPGLAELVRRGVLNKLLSASMDVTHCPVYIIAVPTPIKEDKTADLSYVVQAAESISKVLQKDDLVILESTVSPRCTEKVLVPVLEQSGLKANDDFLVAHCPERVLPGNILFELENNDRIIGGINFKSAESAKEIYDTFVKGKIHLTDATTAELCKLMENTYRDVNIALANELAMICESLGVNAWEVIQLANKHPRVHLHQPGPGVGGHCLAVDPWFIVEAVPEIAKNIRQSRITNDGMPHFLAEKVKKVVAARAKIVILGCTYKPNIEDMRESPILDLSSLLIEKEYNVVIVDPYIQKYDLDPYDAVKGASLVILAVNHDKFLDLDIPQLIRSMTVPRILDTRNFFDHQYLKSLGVEHILLGNGKY